MSENMYKLSSKLAVINNEIVDAEGIITPELEKRLDETGLALHDKGEGIARWIKNIDGHEEAIAQEIKRLQLRKTTTKNLKDRLKRYVKFCMEVAGKKKLEYELFTIAIQKSPPSAKIEKEDLIPQTYFELVPKLDKKEVLRELKKGVEIPGVTLEDTNTHLRIR